MAEGHLRSLQDDYSSLSTSLGLKISKISASSGNTKQQLITAAYNQVEQIYKLIDIMDQELADNPRLKKKYGPVAQRIKAAHDDQRNQLDGVAGHKTSSQQSSVRQQLLEAHEYHDNIDGHLLTTRRVLAESETIGVNVTSGLRMQREQLVNTRDMLEDADESLSRSQITLRRMKRRLMTDRCTQFLIITVELGLISLIVYLKWLK